MEINTNVIYNSFLNNNRRINELLKQAQELTELNINYFMGCLGSQSGTTNKNALVSSNKGGTMKFQGKTIFKNKKCDTWYTRYRIEGKQYYISGKTQKEVLATLKSKLNYQKKDKRQITLLDWYKQWLELFKLGKVKQSTVDVYSSLIKHIPTNILNSDIKNISSLDIQKVINATPGERTKQKLFELLKDIFTKAEVHNICTNVLKTLDKPKHTRQNGIALTNADRQVFEDYCYENKEYVFLVTLYQGLRKGEVLGLTKQDVNFKERTLDINKTLNDKGKFDSTKNLTSKRIMPLFEPSFKILKQIDLSKDRIFCISNAKMQSDFTNIIKTLGLNNKYTIHSLRHTFITNCQDNSVPEHIIQNWVGHSIGSNVTKSVYTHIQKDTNIKNIDILNQSKFYSNSTQF